MVLPRKENDIKEVIHIKPLKSEFIKGLNLIVPQEWGFNLEAFVSFYLEREFFLCCMVLDKNSVVGFGNALVYSNIAWLGNIITDNRYRKKGIGTAITEYLINSCKSRGCDSILLIATELGIPLYSKLGFRKTEEYVFMSLPNLSIKLEHPKSIYPANKNDYNQIMELDWLATGEIRESFINSNILDAVVYKSKADGRIEGFYLPKTHNGLLVSKSLTAGEALLYYKHSHYQQLAVYPSGNIDALRFYSANNIKEHKRAPRMCLGGEANWNPKMIYSRAAGYCG